MIILYKMYVSYIEEQTFLTLYSIWEYEALVSQWYQWDDPAKLHNYWNAAFQSFSWSSFQNLGYLDQAVQAYSGSLEYQEHPVTRANYETSKRLLDLLSQNAQQQQEDAQWQEWDEGSEPQEWQEWESWDSDSQRQNQTTDTRDQWYFLQNDQKIDDLSQQEEQELRNRLDQIEKEKLSNQRYYGKQEPESDLNSIFDNFFWNINRGGEKDW